MIDIQAQNFSLTDAIKSHIEHKLEPIIHHYGDRIINIHVHLSDENGPKGGNDKHCLIHVELQKLPTVVTEDFEENLYTAIDSCCHRAERAVRKSIERKQTLARKAVEP
jgi:ribosomal subunit interface protein